MGGGVRGGGGFQAAGVGGPSGVIVPATLFDVPKEPQGRVSPGTGGVVAIPAEASVVEVIRTLLAFNATESCGKCTPCREGAPRLLALLDELEAGADPEVLGGRSRQLGTTIRLRRPSALRQAVPAAA